MIFMTILIKTKSLRDGVLLLMAEFHQVKIAIDTGAIVSYTAAQHKYTLQIPDSVSGK